MLSTIALIIIDELTMACCQRRIGPLNIGMYGILSSIINGSNLILTQFLCPKLLFHIGFLCFPFIFLFTTFNLMPLLYPSICFDNYSTILVTIVISALSVFFLFLSSFSGCSKYSMLGCIRIISQLIAFELMLTIIFMLSV